MKRLFTLSIMFLCLNVNSQEFVDNHLIDKTDCKTFVDTNDVKINYLITLYNGKNYYSEIDSLRFIFSEDWQNCPLISKGIINGKLLNEIGFSKISCENLLLENTRKYWIHKSFN